MNIVINVTSSTPPVLRSTRDGIRTSRSVVMGERDEAAYIAALAAYGLTSHGFLRHCVGSLIAAHDQQKAA